MTASSSIQLHVVRGEDTVPTQLAEKLDGEPVGVDAGFADRLRSALDATFSFRGTHPLPSTLPAPPGAWSAPYARIAASDALPWPTLGEVLEAARTFLDPVLRGSVQTWDPAAWDWR